MSKNTIHEPNETTEMWRDHRLEVQANKAERRHKNTVAVFEHLNTEEYRVEQRSPYHYSIYKGDLRLDYFPTSMKYHKVWNDRRGHAGAKKIPSLFNDAT